MSDLEIQSSGVKELLRLIEDLKFFLATAPANWQENQVIRRYYLNHDEGFVLCVFWNNLYFITGTDIVRCIVYKFEHFGRKIIDRKKFEEGIFLDLRALKCGSDAILEPPRSEFLSFLFKNACLRTQKKQKVFFWFNVPHDKLMADALERDLKKEKMSQPATTIAHKEPALSFTYDDRNPLFQQLLDHMETQQSRLPPEDPPNDSPEYLERPMQVPKFDKDMFPPPQNNHGELHQLLNQDHHQSNGSVQGQFQQQQQHQQQQQQQLVGGAGSYGNVDYENDFPLDYFETSHMIKEERYPNDFVNIDVGGASGFGMEDQFDNYIDPLVFQAPSTSNQLVFNDEFLIEQTQAIKPLQIQKFGATRILSSKDDYFPLPQPPLSAKNQQHFVRQPVYDYAGVPQLGGLTQPMSVTYSQQQQQQQVPVSLQQQQQQSGAVVAPQSAYVGLPYGQQVVSVGTHATGAPAAVVSHQQTYYDAYGNEVDYVGGYHEQQPVGIAQGGYIVMDGPAQDHVYPAIPIHHPVPLAAPSARQSAISNMMKRKRQEKFGGITKPGALDRRQYLMEEAVKLKSHSSEGS